jgi:hypothetical protein
MIWLAPLLAALAFEVSRAPGADDQWAPVDASSQLRWLEAMLPEAFWSSIRLAVQERGLTFETRRSKDEVFVQVFRAGQRVGYLFAALEPSEDLDEEPGCALWALEDALRIDLPRVWTVHRANLDDGLHGLGVGLMIYLLAFATIGAAGGGPVVPDESSGGETSFEALRVWRTLQALFPGASPWSRPALS